MHYYSPAVKTTRSGLWSLLSSQTIVTGIIFGGSLITALCYFYVTSRSANNRVRLKRKGNKYGVVPSLYNLGNTCYANALLQALAGSPMFVKWVCDLNVSYIEPQNRPILLEALRQIMIQLNDPASDTSSAADVISALLNHRWTIPANSEQDVYELLNVFITTWDEEIAVLKSERVFSLLEVCDDDITNMYSHIKPQSEIVSKEQATAILSSNQQLPDVLSGRFSPLAALSFEHIKKAVADDKQLRAPCLGILVTQLQCCQPSCGYKKLRQDKFCVLSLTIPKCFAGMIITIESLLRKFFGAEVIQGASCDRCVELRNKTSSGLIKRQGFCKLPSTLIMRVERVTYLPSGVVFKQGDHFTFPEILDIRDFCFYRDTMSEYSKSLNATATNSNFQMLGGASSSAQTSTIKSLNNQSSLSEQISKNEILSAVPINSFIREQKESLKYKYQLRSVVVHIGQPQSGHFITYRRGIGSDNQRVWYKTSDTQVTRVTFSEVAASEAYILFYDRILSNS